MVRENDEDDGALSYFRGSESTQPPFCKLASDMKFSFGTGKISAPALSPTKLHMHVGSSDLARLGLRILISFSHDLRRSVNEASET